MQMLLFLVVRSLGLCVQGGVNDTPVVVIAEPEEKSATMLASQWVMPKGNRLTLQAIPAGAEGCPGSVPEGAAPRVEAILSTTPDGQSPVATLTRTFQPGEAVERFELEKAFEASTSSRLWTITQPIESLDKGAKAGALELARSFQKALAARDVEKVVALTEWRTKDVAAVLGENPQAEMKEARAHFTKELKHKLTYEPFDAAQVEARLVGGGHVVALTRAGGPLIRGKAVKDGETREVEYDVYLGQINGHWVIVR